MSELGKKIDKSVFDGLNNYFGTNLEISMENGLKFKKMLDDKGLELITQVSQPYFKIVSKEE